MSSKNKVTQNFNLPTPQLSLAELETILSHSFKNSHNISSPIQIFFHSKDIDNYKAHTSQSNYAYIARKGHTFDGHSLAKKVLESGNIFIGEKQAIEALFTTTAHKIIEHPLFVPVHDTKQTLHTLLEESYKIDASHFLTISVTGTNGKTSVTQLIGHCLTQLKPEPILKIGTLGVQINETSLPVSHVTTPDYPSFLTILAAAQQNNVHTIVMEATSHGLKENRLGSWQSDMAIFTNLTQDHLDYHKTMDDYRAAKQKLFRNQLKLNGTAIININNTEWEHFVQAAERKERNLIVVGDANLHKKIKEKYQYKFSKISFLSTKKIQCDLKGIRGSFVYKNNDTTNECAFVCPLIGEFQIENLLCTVASLLTLNYNLSGICKILANVKPIPGRLESITQNQSSTAPVVLVDYAHTPDALEKSIQTCKKALPANGKLITVFGCGGDRDTSKRLLMGEIAFKLSDIVIVTSDNPRTEDPHKIIADIFHGQTITQQHQQEVDRKKAIEKAVLLATPNDIVLVAGKGHENYQIIGTTQYPFCDADVVRSFLDISDKP